MVELELLAAVWAVKKCRLYLFGLPKFTLVVDHQPLGSILDKFTLDAVENPRLQRLKEKLAPYVVSTQRKNGKSHYIPDALSRAPVADPTSEDLENDIHMSCHIRSIIAAVTTGIEDDPADPIFDQVKHMGSKDEEYQQLIQAIQNGFPKKGQHTGKLIFLYWKIRDELAGGGEIVILGSRIVVPVAMRKEVLGKLHASH